MTEIGQDDSKLKAWASAAAEGDRAAAQGLLES
jgi:hypothetical protein